MTMGIMEVVLVDAKGLKNKDFFGKMDPYVVIQYKNQKYTSRTARGQGSKPVWNEEFNFRVDYPTIDQKYELILQIMDRDTFSRDDYLGQTTVDLKGLFEEGVKKGNADLGAHEKYRVVLTDGTYNGEIQLGIRFTTTAKGNRIKPRVSKNTKRLIGK